MQITANSIAVFINLMQRYVYRCVVCCALSCSVAAFTFVHADTVELRSGTTYTNVKAVPVGNAHRVQFPNGRVRNIPNAAIRSVRPAPVNWPGPAPVQPPPGARVAVIESRPPARQESFPFDLSPLAKSAILPGWGQYAQNRRVSGVLFQLGTACAFQYYWSIREKHAAAVRRYNDPVLVGVVAAQTATGSLTILEAAAVNLTYLAREEREVFRLQDAGNQAFGLLFAVWTWNLLDVIFHSSVWKQEGRILATPTVMPEWGIGITNEAVSVSIRLPL